MAEGGSITKSRRRCPICTEPYKRPKFLKCFHCLCAQCLQDLIDRHVDQGLFKCPMCYADITIPKDGKGAEDFQTNYYLEGEEFTPGTDFLCDVCDKPACSRCSECQETYCKSCAECHPTMNFSRHHHLVSIAKPEVESSVTTVSERPHCGKHKDEQLKYVCKQCDEVICIDCKVTSHENHKSEHIVDAAINMRDELCTVLTSELVLEREATLQAATESNLENACKGYVRNISEQASSLRAAINDIEAEMVKRVQNIVRDNATHDENIDRMLHDTQVAFVSLLETARNMIEVADDLEIVKFGGALKDQLVSQSNGPLPHIPDKIEVQYNPKPINLGSVSDMFGELEVQMTTSKKVDVELLSMFQFPEYKKAVSGIALTSNESVWLSFEQSTSVILADLSGEILQSVDLDACVDDLVLDASGNCYVTCPNAKSIKSISPDMRIQEVMSTMLCPRGLSLSNDTDLVVCLTASPSEHRCREDHETECELMKLSKNGKNVLSIFKNDQNSKPLFGYPIRVSVSVYGDLICVADFQTCSITLLDSYGRPKSTVTGQASGPKIFPHGLCYDKYSRIIVANEFKNSVDYFDESGRYIQKLLSTDGSTGNPRTVAVAGTQLLIGLDDGTVLVYKYLC